MKIFKDITPIRLYQLMGIMAVLTGFYSLRYIFWGINGIDYLADTDKLLAFVYQKPINFWHTFINHQKPQYHKNELAVLTHIIGASIAFITGTIQFIPFFDKKHQSLHKLIGYIYTVSAILGLGLGAYISVALPMIGDVGAIILNIVGGLLGISFIGIGYWHLKQKQYLTHSKWMFRSYAVLYTLLTLYILIGVFAICQIPVELSYKMAHWLCLPINLVLAQIIINKKRLLF